MFRKVLFGLAVFVAVTASLLWIERREVLFWLVRVATLERNIAPYQPIRWETGPEVPARAPGNRPPNIVVILADDLGINDITLFGGGVSGGRVPTPNIDRIAHEGLQFTQGYAGNATCAPSRAMLLTGRYPARTGFAFTPAPPSNGRFMAMLRDDGSAMPPTPWDPDASARLPPMHEQGMPGSEVTIAEMLQGAGYTVHIGKWHLGNGDEFGPNAQGFDESLLQMSGLYLPEDDPHVVNAKLDFSVIDRFLWAAMQYEASFDGGPSFEPGGYLTDWWTNEAVKG